MMTKQDNKIMMSRFKKEMGRLTKADLTTCPICKKKFKKLNQFISVPNCKHYPKNMMLSMG